MWRERPGGQENSPPQQHTTIMAFAAARILKDKKDQQELKMVKSPDCINMTRALRKVGQTLGINEVIS